MPVITQDTLSTVLTLTSGLWRAGGLKGVTFKGVRFDKPVRLDGNPEEVTFDGCTFRGAGEAPALTIDSGRKITISGGEVAFAETGVKVFNITDLIVRWVHFHDIAFDGLSFGQLDRFLFDGNSFTDWVPYGDKHPDAIQGVKPDARTGPSRNGVIRGNTIVLRKAQGINIDQIENVVVEGNSVTTDMAIAIGCAKSKGVTLRGNTVGTYPPSSTIARFDLREAVGLKVEAGNVVRPYGRRTANV